MQYHLSQALDQLVYLHWLNLAPIKQYEFHNIELKKIWNWMLLKVAVIMIIVLKILDVIGEETKLLLPGSRIIIGRMHMQYPNFTNFPPSCYHDWKSVFSLLYKESNPCFSPERKHMNRHLTKRLISCSNSIIAFYFCTLILNGKISSQAYFLVLVNRRN